MREPLGYRLLSLHNLTHYNGLMAEMREHIVAGTFGGYHVKKIAEIDRHAHAS